MAAADDEREYDLVPYLIGEKFTETGRGPALSPDRWSGLPDEMLEEVLLWVPASAQARFRAVSKAWRGCSRAPNSRNTARA